MNAAKFILVFLLGIALLGCANQAPPDQWRLRKDLMAEGVIINQVGETLELILPNNLLFNAGSANLKTHNNPSLVKLAQLIAMFETKQITITGFDHSTPDDNYNVALALKRAQVLKNYLWRNNMDARLINTEGKTYPADLAEIRIQFMYLPAIWQR
jgi:outer membrane protein OmpA-like peptidoglycan-associated protein